MYMKYNLWSVLYGAVRLVDSRLSWDHMKIFLRTFALLYFWKLDHLLFLGYLNEVDLYSFQRRCRNKVEKDLRRFHPITFTISEKSNHWRKRGNKAKHCWLMSTFFWFKHFVDNAQQCFAFTPRAKFSAHNLNFHWRWWDWIQATF